MALGLFLAAATASADPLPRGDERVAVSGTSNPFDLDAWPAFASATAEGPTIDVWHGDGQTFGVPGLAQFWINILGNVSDPDGISRLDYSLNSGGFRVLSVGPDGRRLEAPGDFNLDLNPAVLQAGVNTVLLRARDTRGFLSERLVTLNWNRRTWPMPYSIDWDLVTDVTDVAQVVDGLWTVVPGGVSPTRLGYDRLLAIGDVAWQDYEIRLDFTLLGLDPEPPTGSSGKPGFGVILRWPGHTDNPVVCSQPKCGWFPHGSSAWYRFLDATGGTPSNLGGSIVDPSGARIGFGTTYEFKMRVETVGTSPLYRYRIWRAGDPEPTDWNASGPGNPTVASGSALIVAHHVAVRIGDVQIVRLPDGTPPEPPAGLDGDPSSAYGVVLEWLPATDDSEIAEYRVLRDGVVVGIAVETRFVDQPLAADRAYRYAVIAVDDSGNASVPSDEIVVRTPPAPAGPECGNGQLEPGEQCDDGDTQDGDDCSSLCLLPLHPADAVINGDFSNGLASWFFTSDGSASAGASTGAATVAISTPGNNVQLSQRGIRLRGGTRHRLELLASSLDGADVQVVLLKDVAPFTVYGLQKVLDLGSAARRFSVEFVTTPGDKSDARLMLALGSYDRAGSRYMFDDVSIREVASTSCGNGQVDAGEACDDGDLDNTDGCLNDCRAAQCGDGWLRPASEDCDDGNRTDGDGCAADCTVDTDCGDGVVDPGEACDDGTANSNSAPGACRSNCRGAHCGDGVQDPGESCDGGGATTACDVDCSAPVCGDGVRNAAAGEACDDGNLEAGDGCSGSCRQEFCGNGILDPAEACDDGAQTAACDADCTLPVCGDGRRNAAAGEACDDGNGTSGDGCSAACVAEVPQFLMPPNGDFSSGSAPWRFYSNGSASFDAGTGAGRVAISVAGTNVQLYQSGLAIRGGTEYRLRFRGRNTAGTDVQVVLLKHTSPWTIYGLERVVDLETEDRSFALTFVTPPGDRSDARLMFAMGAYDRAGTSYFFDDVVLEIVTGGCGNGAVEAGEECDDGNAVAGDGCSASCHREASCGNGVAESGEECDDGNTADGDGCSAACHREPACGDGAVDPGEACDDGNASSGDGCSAACALEGLGENAVPNGDFSAGAAPWQFHGDGKASFGVAGGEARVAITVPGNAVQLYQVLPRIEGATRYRLRFRGRNTGGDDVRLRLFQHVSPWASYGLDVPFNLDSADGTFSAEFRTPPGDRTDARLVFWIGPYDRAGMTYYFDDVTLEQLPD